MSCVRVTAFVGLAAAALTALSTVSATAEPYDYGQEVKRACEQQGLEPTESIYLPGTLPATATCHEPGQDTVRFVPLPKDTYCTVPGVFQTPGKADGEGNCLTD
ncbi:hypothetical protein [Nocardia brasiliensis]|uniref:hypothetical protein n=1 Tax=Nocardia brasiliensis TaxID=37326 RepID=UPI00366C6569